MQSGISFRSSALAPRRVLPFTLPVALLALLLVHSPLFPAQAAPASPSGGMIGSIEGTDVSVEGPSAPDNSNETITHSILVGNGSVVTVHSGQAHMALATGGEVDIHSTRAQTLCKLLPVFLCCNDNAGRAGAEPRACEFVQMVEKSRFVFVEKNGVGSEGLGRLVFPQRHRTSLQD